VNEAFRADMAAAYTFKEPVIVLGSPILDDEVDPTIRVALPLSRVNRHGLIAGATGTGKTKTLQLLAGQLSAAGVPVFAVDVKGDLSGVGMPGDPANPAVMARVESMKLTFVPQGAPVEILSLSGKVGAHVRASVSSFGPLLLGKVLDLNDTQTSILSLVFRYCDDEDLPLLDLADLRTTLKFLGSEEGKPILAELGGISPASLGVILRAIVTVEQEGADVFFGEPEFDVEDMLRSTPDGRGVVTLLEVADVMDRPRLYSTFVLWMLAQLYEQLPEVGDLPKPKLAFFFDEAHLLFKDASDALMEQIERTARLIRSKGVGVYFVTQAPTDVPSSVLSQLGNRVQHALRAFTPEDADALRKAARTFPMTDHYDVERTLTSLGIGEAFVTVLNPKGVPTALAATRLVPPDSRMAPMTPEEIASLVAASSFATKYNTAIDPQSAHEIITARLTNAKAAAATAAAEAELRGQVSPTTSDGLDTMTPAQQRR
jgi:DNA helicase HerA-like ATPase